MGGQHEAHQRFWQQVVLWLAHKDRRGTSRCGSSSMLRRFRVGTAGGDDVRGRDADKRPIDDAVFTVEVIDPEERAHA